jgi:multidrug efflux system outer membrane protein
MKRVQIVLPFVVLGLAGCIAPVKFQESKIPTPNAWTHVQSSSAVVASIDQQWWKRFDDPTLDQVIEEALLNNKSLAIAKERIKEARAVRGVSRSALMPQINGTVDASRGNLGILYNNQIIAEAEAEVQASWEIDLFGRNQARSAQAQALLQAAQAGEQGVVVSLLAEVARDYFDLRNYDRQLEITRQNLVNQEKTLDLIKVQVEGSMASDFDVQRAGAQVSATKAQIPTLEVARTATLNRLNVLLGSTPGSRDALLEQAQPLKPIDPGIIVAAPAAILLNRPDVRAAERQLAAAMSGHRAATADLFPRITLLGFYGIQTSQPYVMSPWSLGGNLVQPILNFGLLRSQLKIANARQAESFYLYQQTVLEALENMEDALSAFVHEFDRNRALGEAVSQNGKASELATLQFKGGFTSLLDLLIAERNVLDAETSLAASDTALRKNLIGVYAAAGGGWDVKVPRASTHEKNREGN